MLLNWFLLNDIESVCGCEKDHPNLWLYEVLVRFRAQRFLRDVFKIYGIILA